MPKKKELYTNEELAECFGLCYAALLSLDPGLATVQNAASRARIMATAMALIKKGDDPEKK